MALTRRSFVSSLIGGSVVGKLMPSEDELRFAKIGPKEDAAIVTQAVRAAANNHVGAFPDVVADCIGQLVLRLRELEQKVYRQ